MTGRPQVSIRLATSGKGDVQRDFADIADAGSAQASRLRAKWESETSQIEALTARAAKTAQRLSEATATPAQQMINSATGVGGGQSGAAAASAKALAAELERAEREAHALIAAVDPLFAAQSRYTAQVEQINRLKGLGVLNEETYLRLLANEKGLLDEATQSAVRNNNVRAQTRAGFQQLSFQAGDVAQQLALGTRAGIIFAQQSGQVIQAMQMMGGEGNAVVKFLGGPWGIALSTAAVVLLPFIGRLLEAGDASDGLVTKLKKEADQEAVNDRAHAAFADTIEGVTAALRDNRKALDGMADAEKSAAERALASALAQAEKAQRIREATVAILHQQEAELQSARQQTFGAAGGAGAGAAIAFYSGQVADLQQQLKKAESDAAIAAQQVQEATSRVYVEAVLRDPVDRIKKRYDGLIESTRQRLVAEHATTDEIARQTELLRQQRDAKIKAEQDANRKGPENAGGTAIFNEQIATFFGIASKYRGMSEKGDRGQLKAFLGNVDPEKTAWCAAFINAVLAAGGVTGSGSLAAKSFLTYGKDDTRSPQRGDIVVVKSAASPSGTHAGFLDSIDKAGNVRILGGNTGNRVGEATFSKSAVLAIRRPPTPSESAAATEKASDQALRAQDAFDTERAKLNDALLRELGKVAVGYEAQAAVQQRQVQSDHDAEAKDIATSLAQGKYGEATSQLAQTRAQQLQQANDDLLKERQAAIARERNAEAMKRQDMLAERESGYKLEALEFAESQARSTKERRAIDLQIVDLQYEEKKRHLEYLKALAELAGNTQDAADLQDQINHLPEERDRARKGANDNNMPPLVEWLKSIPQTASEVNDALEGIASKGLQSLNDGLADAIVNSKSLGDVFHNVAKQILEDLIKLALEEAEVALFKAVIGAVAGGHAAGTEYAPGGMTWVGENGPELVAMPTGSKVYTASASRRMAADNDGGPRLAVSFHNDFRGADASAVSMIQARLDRMEAELPGQIVQTYNDARKRFLIRN
jgi:uncharacterized protein (TIGR02594 family)